MIIAIASKRGPKVEAVKQVVASIRRYLSPDTSTVRYITCDIDGGIAMPRTLGELLTGARQRVVNLERMLQAQRQHAQFLVGLEGGFHTVAHHGRKLVFLQSWVYISDGKVGYYGSSGNIIVPDAIVLEVMRKKRDLGEVIDEVAKQTDVRSKQGTWGILTRDLLTRQQSFEIALTAAFAPFYNRELYESEEH